MMDLLLALMLVVTIIAGYLMGKTEGKKKYTALSEKYDKLLRIHNDLLSKPWVKADDQGYWAAEDEFKKSPEK